MSKYTWDEMPMCQTCHFKGQDPDICNAFNPPRVKPCAMGWRQSCRWTRESKWERMPESERQRVLKEFGIN